MNGEWGRPCVRECTLGAAAAAAVIRRNPRVICEDIEETMRPALRCLARETELSTAGLLTGLLTGLLANHGVEPALNRHCLNLSHDPMADRIHRPTDRPTVHATCIPR